MRETSVTPVTKSAGLSKSLFNHQRKKKTILKEEFLLLLMLIYKKTLNKNIGERFNFKFKRPREMNAIPIFTEWTLPEIS